MKYKGYIKDEEEYDELVEFLKTNITIDYNKNKKNIIKKNS